MTGLHGISAYQQINKTWQKVNNGVERANASAPSEKESLEPIRERDNGKIDRKPWSPIDTTSSLVPKKTEYGNAIGNVQLSDKAKEYYEKLKGKFHNMEFIAVSKDMKAQVKQNAAAYGNASKMVVLIDEEKLEQMAADESFRKKYEGIIAMSQNKLEAAKNSLASSGANVKSFGMSVDANGKESFFATVEKSQDIQKKNIEKKAAEKREQKVKEKKKTEKKKQEERIQKAKDKKAEKTDKEDKNQLEEEKDKGYVTFEATSVEELFSRVQSYSYNAAASMVMTEAEKALGARIDFKG